MGPVKRRISNAASLPSTNGVPREVFPKKDERTVGRRVRVTRDSRLAIPFAAIVAFALLVLGLIVFLFRQQSTSPGKPFQPGGVPPRIRSAWVTQALTQLR